MMQQAQYLHDSHDEPLLALIKLCKPLLSIVLSHFLPSNLRVVHMVSTYFFEAPQRRSQQPVERDRASKADHFSESSI